MKGSEKYKEILELMPAIQEASIKGLKKDFQEYDYDIKKIKPKLRMFSDIISVIQGKWTFEICLILLMHGECSYNELKRDYPEINSRTFTDRLRSLETKKIIRRTVKTKKQLRVYYQLTPFGKQLILFYTPVLVSFAMPFEIRKDLPKIKSLKSISQHKLFKDEDFEIELIGK